MYCLGGKRARREVKGEVSMKATTTLAVVLVIIGAAPEVRAQHTSVIINLTSRRLICLRTGESLWFRQLLLAKRGGERRLGDSTS